ncbi:hypothetical protein L210DRAFT_2841182 [Boletus edulis BED1]|uniref:Uncharacterized protein n=1 Tax=Boletus edulis BED1 TaxID=1328754 RepID=A0AAD4BJW5_BOLED|nr:hypothetical protein L210DRAFT_2841182 [Boletus edulis BED1]
MTMPSELDVYFPIQPVPAVTTHLLVPLAPTPTARLPLSAHNDGGGAHPLLPIADLASIHTTHRLHSLRVSTLFARLDAANVWDDPGVNVDAYAFGPRHNAHDTQEKQCTVLRVTFRGWNTTRVRSILGDSAEEWYSLEESHPDRHPDLRQTVYMNTRSQSPSLESVAREIDKVDPRDVPVSAQHDLVFPTLDFSDAVDNVPPPPPPVMFLRTVSELTRDAELASQSSSVLTDVQNSWEWVGSNSSFAGEHGWDQFAEGV